MGLSFFSGDIMGLTIMRIKHKEDYKKRLDSLEDKIMDMRRKLTEILMRLHDIEQMNRETRLLLPKLENELRQEISTLIKTLQFK
jgi:septal ring factor EnvC (AmiA/AmiB activator)